MNQKKTNAFFAVILIAVIAFGIISTVSLNSAREEIESLQYSLSNANNRIGSLEYGISQIEWNIRQELERQASLLTSYDITTGVPDPANMTSNVAVNVIPKEFAEDMTAVFYVGGEAFELTRRGNAFKGVATVSASKNYNDLSVTFTYDGTSKTETLKDNINFAEFFMYSMKADFDNREAFNRGAAYKDGKISFNGNISAYWSSQFANNSVKSANVCIYKNDNKIYSEVIPSSQLESFKISPSFDASAGDTFRMYVEIIDAYGFTYLSFAAGVQIAFDKNGNGQFVAMEMMIDGNEVYDPNGNKLEFYN